MCNYAEKTKLKEECGVFAIYDNDNLDVAHLTYCALFALQHRGQESSGIAVNSDGTILQHKDKGVVPDVFNEVILNYLKGNMAVGHVRYCKASESSRENAQPLVSKYVKGTLTIAYNGSILNAQQLRADLEQQGAIFQTSSDAELITYMIARERLGSKSVEEAITKVIPKLDGAYSMVIMSPKKLIAVRDPHGIRPLSMGKIRNSHVFVSETCALNAIGADFVRDIEPGEIVVVSEDGVKSIRDNVKNKASICVFEYIYFARPDSVIEGRSVYESRKAAGRCLAKAHPVDADIVIGVPDSGLNAALGYAEESGIPYGEGLIKNRYIGRTFIQPTQHQRVESVDIKLNVLRSSIEGKRVVMVDDSIVRGTTCAKLVHMLKKAGAKEVHMRISSPEFLWRCFFGTDIPSRKDLMACNYTVDEMCKKFGADSLGFLPIENLKDVMAGTDCNWCEGCFTGKYPIEITEEQ